MTIYLVIPLMIAVTLLQVTLIPRLSVWGVFADLPLLLVLSWGLLRGAREGAVWGFVAGLFTDLFSGGPFGAATLSLMAAGALSALGRNVVFRHYLLLPPLIAFGGTVVYDLLFLLVLAATGQPVVWLGTVARIILPSAALNACLILIVLGLTRLLHLRFSREVIEI
jgi:rod shape-determining protein MreD